ncbi:hypothetical protein [Devriesea agamarum]|uniref:hypothetical protein n=1 Tax=Devriesea agamarum TaxID=472569 RepID=UPI0012EED53B|nr:hypothetical protein [Devriesea agamarum]
MDQASRPSVHPAGRRDDWEAGLLRLADIAQRRARGWRAVAKIIGECDEDFRAWILSDAGDELRDALEWRWGEEAGYSVDLYVLGRWMLTAGRTHNPGWERIAAAARPDQALARDIQALAESIDAEADAWREYNADAAREARADSVSQIGELAHRIQNRGTCGGAPQPYRALDRLALIFVAAETGQPQLNYAKLK